MAIDLQSLSLTSAFNSIVSYFRSQENNTAFRDLSNTSEGSFIIRLLANVISVLSYRIVAQSRENYLSTAALTSSNVGIAVNLGYSVFRGSNLKRLIYLTPTGNYTLPKFSVIGTYNDEYSIITLDDLDLVQGKQEKIRTVVGNVREESFTTGTSAIKIFSLFTTGISEDYVLFKDNEEVPTTKVMKDMIYDKYLVRTNPYSSVDVAYLNTFSNAKYKYGNGTEITIRYIELADVPVIPYSSNMFMYGNLDNYATISPYLAFEPVDSIKVTAPLDHETQNLIRSKVDYANRLQEIIPAVNEVNFKALTPTYTQITYLKDDFTLLTGTKQEVGSAEKNSDALVDTEVEEVTEILKGENYFGTPLPDIVVPRREVADLDISIALTNKYKNIADINLDIENILRNYYNTYLSVKFSTYDLERQIEELSYVRYARVALRVSERKTSTNYQLGYTVSKKDVNGNTNYYKATKILGYTGAQEPENGWNIPLNPGTDIDTGAVTKDGTLYWKCYKRLSSMPGLSISTRQPSKQYGIGDFMRMAKFPEYMFKCIDLVRESGYTSPDTTTSEIGNFIVDSGIVWVVKDRISEAPAWEALHQYRLGDTVNAIGDEFSLECISYTGTTGTDPDLPFEQYSYSITGVEEQDLEGKFIIPKNQTYYFSPGDLIRAIPKTGADKTFVVANSTYLPEDDKDYTEVTVTTPISENFVGGTLEVQQIGTKDGGILWSLIDDMNNVEYNWNSYVTFSHHLNILE